jgi:hypothetical protein
MMPNEIEIGRLVREIARIEARLIAARHLRLTDRIRLLESQKRRLEARLTELQAEPSGAPPSPQADLTGSSRPCAQRLGSE